MSVPRFEKGNTVQIQSTFADSEGKVVEPDGKQASIEIKDLDTGEVMVNSTSMLQIKDTLYQYNWDTTEGMNTGEYEVEVSGEISSDDVVNRDRIRLEDIIFDDGAGC